MASVNHINNFNNIKESWNKIDFNKIYRQDLGTASFISIKQIINELIIKIQKTDKVKDLLGDNVLEQFYTNINNIINQLKNLSNLNDSQFISEKERIGMVIQTLNEQVLNVWPLILIIINDFESDFNIKKTLKEVEELKKVSITDSNQIGLLREQMTREFQTFQERYKNEVFAKSELLKQENEFNKDANDFKARSVKWLKALIGVILIMLITIIIIFKNFCFELGCFINIKNSAYDTICQDCNKMILYLEITKAVTYRLLIISFLTYFITICVKNYNSNMHNYTINKHKANSLAAALILLDNAKTNEGNDEIMKHAATAIFSHQATGFNNKEPQNFTSLLTGKLSNS